MLTWSHPWSLQYIYCLFLEVERTFVILGYLGLYIVLYLTLQNGSIYWLLIWYHPWNLQYISLSFFISRENIWYTRKPRSFALFSSGGLRPPLHGLYNNMLTWSHPWILQYISLSFFISRENIWYTRKPRSFSMFSTLLYRMGLYIGCWYGIIHEFYNIYHCLFLEVERTFDILGNRGLFQCSLSFFTEWIYIFHCSYSLTLASHARITYCQHSRGLRPRGGNYT